MTLWRFDHGSSAALPFNLPLFREPARNPADGKKKDSSWVPLTIVPLTDNSIFESKNKECQLFQTGLYLSAVTLTHSPVEFLIV